MTAQDFSKSDIAEAMAETMRGLLELDDKIHQINRRFVDVPGPVRPMWQEFATSQMRLQEKLREEYVQLDKLYNAL